LVNTLGEDEFSFDTRYVVAVNNGGVAGEDEDTLVVAGEDIVVSVDGFSGFESTAGSVEVLSVGSSGADVINNFQTANDKIVLEADLAESTLNGVVDHVLAEPSAQSVTFQPGQTSDSTGPIYVLRGDIDLTREFSFASDFKVVAGSFNTSTGEYPYSWYAAAGTYANLQAFEDALNAGRNVGNDKPISLEFDGKTPRTIQIGEGQETWYQSVKFEVADMSAYFQETDEITGGQITGTSLTTKEFDLDDQEFGLITSLLNDQASQTVNAQDLGDVTKVAALLNELFDFDAGNDNGVINTSVFAITAADNSSKTGLWAHQQSSTDDGSVDASELQLLAVVNTLGDEFKLENLSVAGSVIPV